MLTAILPHENVLVGRALVVFPDRIGGRARRGEGLVRVPAPQPVAARDLRRLGRRWVPDRGAGGGRHRPVGSGPTGRCFWTRPCRVSSSVSQSGELMASHRSLRGPRQQVLLSVVIRSPRRCPPGPRSTDGAGSGPGDRHCGGDVDPRPPAAHRRRHLRQRIRNLRSPSAGPASRAGGKARVLSWRRRVVPAGEWT